MEILKMIKEKEMKKYLKPFIVFSVVSLLTLGSFAQPGQMMKRGRGFGNMSHAAERSPVRIILVLKAKKEELKITDEQLKKVEDLAFSFEEKMIQARNAASLQQLELRKLMQDRGNLDYDKIREELSKASESRSDMFIDRLKLRDEIQGILTPEQQEKLKVLQQEGPRGKRQFLGGERQQRPHRFLKFRNRIN